MDRAAGTLKCGYCFGRKHSLHNDDTPVVVEIDEGLVSLRPEKAQHRRHNPRRRNLERNFRGNQGNRECNSFLIFEHTFAELPHWTLPTKLLEATFKTYSRKLREVTHKLDSRKQHEVTQQLHSRKQQRGQHRVKRLKAVASSRALKAANRGNKGEARSKQHELTEGHFRSPGAEAASQKSAWGLSNAAAAVEQGKHIGELKRSTADRNLHVKSMKTPTHAAADEETH